MKIFVMERGFVLIGEEENDSDDFLFLTLKRCAVIRQWGTTHGLGQLAFSGPTSETVFDPEPEGTTIRKTAIDRAIPCTWEGWTTWTPYTEPSVGPTRRRK